MDITSAESSTANAVDGIMRIWLITVGEPLPTDGDNVHLVRTGILAGLLEAAGHHVVWWSSSFNHTAKVQRCRRDTTLKLSPKFELKLLHAAGYAQNVSLRRILHHRRIARKFAAAAIQEEPPNVILCSFPTIELSKAATDYGKSRGVPVVVDVRDLWPDALVGLFPRVTQPLAKVLLGRMFRAARTALQQSDAIIGVSAGYLEWGLRFAGRDRHGFDRVFPLGYQPAPVADEEMRVAEIKLRACGVDPSKVICWFAGVFGRTYDLATVIDAARELPADLRGRVQFVLCGDGEYRDRWMARSSGLDSVVFPGWIGASELAYLMKVASIGIAAYAPGAPQGLPNKLFEYMSAGLPVLSSLRGEAEALLRQHGCGLSYQAGDRRSFLDALCTLLDQRERRAQMGRNGRRLFDEQFSTDRVYAGLGDYLLEIARAV